MLEGKTRIPPVDIEALPGDLREVLEEQRKRYGAPLYPYLFYARNAAYFPRRAGDVDSASASHDEGARYTQSAAQPSGCFVERLPVLNGLQCCRGQQIWCPNGKDRRARRLREEPTLH